MRRLSCSLCLAFACTYPAPGADPAPRSSANPAPAQLPAREFTGDPRLLELAAGAPVTAIALGVRMGMPPLRFYGLRLTLENLHDEPTWLLFASSIDDRLPVADPPDASTVRLASTTGPRVPFGGHGYPQRDRKVIEVRIYAGPGFRAYHLPPRARVVLDGIGFDGWSDVDRMDVWEVRDILVNGEQPLADWLPYPVTASAGVTVRDFSDWENLDWDYEQGQGRKNYPKDTVTHVTIDVLRRWVIPLQGIESLGPPTG